MTPRRSRRTLFVVRRVALLTLLVACLVVPVVAIAATAFGSHGQGTSSELVCSQTSNPCQLPKSAASP
jgi:hypothetical protein